MQLVARRMDNSRNDSSLRSAAALDEVSRLPNGARFFKCALQVNPYGYVKRHTSNQNYSSESDYNKSMVDALIDNGIEVIAITDHYRVSGLKSLQKAATAAGLKVLPGFEAVTKEGVHMLCIFDSTRSQQELERIIGHCGIHDESVESPVGSLDVLELLRESRNWKAAVIAAHVAGGGGLLKMLKGQARINAWTSSDLLACALPGSASDAPNELRPIIKNQNSDYKRERKVAVVNAKDVSDPMEVADPGATCWIKMSEVSVEGLRQAFLDPESRIRLASDPQPEDHAELLRMKWEGGFLDGAAIHFNPNLNVLVGGRGTGKSTIVESIRYVLGLSPIGSDATNAHNDIVKRVLRSGTKISLVVSSHRPARREYLIERTVPNPPIVRDENGEVLSIDPVDIIPRIEIFGQHEISELTKPGAARTHLLERFLDEDVSIGQRKIDIQRQLAKSRSQILEVEKDIGTTEERLGALPGLEDTLKRFKDAGLESRLKEQSEIVKEERITSIVPDRVAPFHELLESFREELPIDSTFLSFKALNELPGAPTLRKYEPVLDDLSRDLERVGSEWQKALELAGERTKEIDKEWTSRKQGVQEKYEKILRELQKSSVDGEEFIRLRRQIENLRPLREQVKLRRATMRELFAKRRNFLVEWEDIKAEQYRRLDKAAKRVSRKLKHHVRVEIKAAGDREALTRLLRKRVGGQLAKTIERFEQLQDLSLTQLADSCRAGSETLREKFGLTPTQAKNIADADPSFFLEIEERELEPTTSLQLNIAATSDEPVWRALEELSTGQKATAILLLLLLESDAPLVVDQPEDDLDNRFITEGVVPKMRDEKRKRQFLFATHNANVPVLGDAELILGLVATGEADEGRARIPRELMGSIDSQPGREMVEEILEGGKAAFEMRRLKYGF